MDPAAPADLARTWALVPIRGLETAKTRLGGGLDAEERRDLVIDLLRRTLAATRDSRRVAGTIVVTMDPDAAGIARDHGAIGLVERAPGLNAAIVAARSLAVARGATAVLVLPADLPAIDAGAVDALIEAAEQPAVEGGSSGGMSGAASGGMSGPASGDVAGVVVVVADRHGAGTNALLVSPPGLVDPMFGPASHELHVAAAVGSGARLVEVGGPLAFDVDTPEDLVAAGLPLGTGRG